MSARVPVKPVKLNASAPPTLSDTPPDDATELLPFDMRAVKYPEVFKTMSPPTEITSPPSLTANRSCLIPEVSDEYFLFDVTVCVQSPATDRLRRIQNSEETSASTPPTVRAVPDGILTRHTCSPPYK